MRSRSLLILLTASLALSCVRMGVDRQTENLLAGLDNYLETRDLYVAQKQNQLAALSLPVSELAFYGLDMVKKVEPGDFQLWVAGDSASGEALSFKVK